MAETEGSSMADDQQCLIDPTGATRALMFEAAFELLYQRAGASGVFGSSSTLACDTYRCCLVGDAQPLAWLEVPLLGEPGFDMDVSYRRDQLGAGDRFIWGDGYGYQPLVDWAASTKQLPFGIGIAIDLTDGERGHGAYVNSNNIDAEMRDGFFRAIGQEEAGVRLARVAARQPDGWRQAEDGVFIGRPGCPARIAWLVDERLKQEYVKDARLLAKHLRQVGFTALDSSLLACLRDMAATPFKMWVELDVLADGSVGDSLGADYYFSSPVLRRSRPSFAEGQPATRAMEALQARGLADERWRLLADATTATLVALSNEEGGRSAFLMRSEPTFVKAKWVPGKTPLAKAYQIVDVKLLGWQSRR